MGHNGVGVLANDVLLVLVEQVVEDLFVQKGNALEVVTRARLETDDFIDEAVRLVRQVRDVLLSLHLLLHIGGVVSDLQLDGVCASMESSGLARL